MSNEISTIVTSYEQLPVPAPSKTFNMLAKAGNFLGRLQLYSKGKAVARKFVSPGNYGIPQGQDEVTDLGDRIDVYFLARRPKAMDMSDMEAIRIVYDPECAEFERIKQASEGQDSHCMWGISFLVYLPDEDAYLEFFCGTKSTRLAARKMFPYLPLTQAMIDADSDLSDEEPHGPRPATLSSRYVEKGTFSWHVPVIEKGPSDIDPPQMEQAVAEIQKFLSLRDEGSKKIAETNPGRAH